MNRRGLPTSSAPLRHTRPTIRQSSSKLRVLLLVCGVAGLSYCLLFAVQSARPQQAGPAPRLQLQVRTGAGLGRVKAGLARDAGEFYRVGGRKVGLFRSLEKVAIRHRPGRGPQILRDIDSAGRTRRSYRIESELAGHGITMLQAEKLQSLQELGESIVELEQRPGVERAVPVYIQQESGLEVICTEQFIVKLAPQATIEHLQALNNRSGAVIVELIRGTTNQFILSLAGCTAEELLQVCETYSQEPAIEWAEPDFLGRITKHDVTPNDPYFKNQWHLKKVNAPQAWDVTTGSSQVVIAIIDDGIDFTHEDLAANVAVNPNEIPNNGLDDDLNGYVDDYRGWNFFDNDEDAGHTDSFDGHGTATAGIAAAVGNNSIGIAGTAFTCKVMPLKIIRGMYVASSAKRAEAIRYAAGLVGAPGSKWRGADVISISLGLSQTNVTDAALHDAATMGRGGKGCAIFCSAGNEAAWWMEYGLMGFPGGQTFTLRWEYAKDGSGSGGADTVWLDCVTLPGGATEKFEAGLPAGWRTGGNAGWTSVQNGVGGNHAMTGWGDGLSSRSMRAGAIGNNQSSYIEVQRSFPAGDLTFWAWLSMAWGDELRFYVDGEQYFGDSDNPTVWAGLAYPASHPDTIAVGASTDFDYRSDYSEYGTGLDFLAPSSGGSQTVWVTDRTGLNGYNEGNYEPYFGGTSVSAPLAAGVAALMLSVDPNLTVGEIRTTMRNTCDKIGTTDVQYDGAGWNQYYGYGRINAQRAVNAAIPGRCPTAQNSSASTAVNVPVTITLTATDDGQPAALSYFITAIPRLGKLNEPNVGYIWTVPYLLKGNQVTYVPYTNCTGSDTFTFKANDGGVPPEGGDSNVATVTVSVSNLFLEENFEAPFVSGAPPGWTKSYVPDTEDIDWYRSEGDSRSTDAAFEGRYNAMLYYPSTIGEHKTWLIRQIAFQAGTTQATLEFAHKQVAWSGNRDALEVYYKTSDQGDWNLLASYTQSVPDWVVRSIELPNLGNPYYIGFLGSARAGRGVCIDAVKISAATPGGCQPYLISGTVTLGGSGLAGVQMLGLPGEPLTDAEGRYAANVPSGWVGRVTPAKACLSFSPAYYDYAGVTQDQMNKDYAAVVQTYTISGYVRAADGSGIIGVSVSANNGGGSAATNSSGLYSLVVPCGWSGRVTTSLGCYTFSPTRRDYMNVISPQANQDFTGLLLTYTISGYVRTPDGTGVDGVLMAGLPGDPVTDSSGRYTATVTCGWSGTVKPQKPAHVFVPADKTYSGIAADDAQDYSAYIPPQIISTPATVATAGELYTYDVNSTGVPAPTYSLMTYPTGMTIDPNTGLIEWTPDVQQIGSHSVEVKAANAGLPDAVQQFTVVVSRRVAVIAVVYVDSNAPLGGDGSSWEKAFVNLQDALSMARDPAFVVGEIRLGAGTYRPDRGNAVTPGDRSAAFELMNGLAIRGGYAGLGATDPNGNPIDPNTRDIKLYEAILSGDLDGNDVGDMNDPSMNENGYHIVSANAADETAVLDGVTVRAGNADGSGSDGQGGGIIFHQGSPTITNCAFTANRAAYTGGAMFCFDGSPTLIHCTFEGNFAGFRGGGAEFSWSRGALTDCIFTANSSQYCGGAICNVASNPTLTNSTFTGNYAIEYGGAIENESGSNTILIRCTFAANSTPNGKGGAIHNMTSDPTLNGCTFNNNHAFWGGAINNYDSSPTLTGCTFTGNSAEEMGGAMRSDIVYGPACNPRLTDCIFSGNSAGKQGGAVSNVFGNPMYANCTFTGNSAETGAVMSNYLDWRQTIKNCILWNGKLLQADLVTGDPNITYSDVQGGWPGEGNIDADPCFVKPGYWADANDPNLIVEPNDPNAVWIAGDYHLRLDSPCINAGDPNYVPEPNETDFDGNPRVVMGIIDMGAYEFGLPRSHKDYEQWLAAGEPLCWCYPRQCHGDADGKCEGTAQTGLYYVGFYDIDRLISAWMVKEPPHGPGIASIPNGICADFAHNRQGDSDNGYYRVGLSDLNILIANWLVKEPPSGAGVKADCARTAPPQP